MMRSCSSARTHTGRALCIPSLATQKRFAGVSNLRNIGCFSVVARMYVCVCACAKLSIVSPDWVPVATKSWFARVLCRSKSGSGAQTCGVFSNWIWQSRTHCSLRRRVAGSLAEPPLIQPIPFPNGMVQSCPRTFQTARRGGADRLENWRQSATTLNVD